MTEQGFKTRDSKWARPISLQEVRDYLREEVGLETPPVYETIYRWATKGINGVTLNSDLLGGRIKTTRTDVDVFFNEVNQARGGSKP